MSQDQAAQIVARQCEGVLPGLTARQRVRSFRPFASSKAFRHGIPETSKKEEKTELKTARALSQMPQLSGDSHLFVIFVVPTNASLLPLHQGCQS
jgi:hypothetical protein